MIHGGDDTWSNIMGEVHGAGYGLLPHGSYVLDVAGEKPVRIPGEALLSEAPLKLLRPQPNPVQISPSPYG